MTDEEVTMLRDIHRELFEVPKGSPPDAKPLIVGMRELANALLTVPSGSPKNTASLLSEITSLVIVYKRSSWLINSLLFLVPLAWGVWKVWSGWLNSILPPK